MKKYVILKKMNKIWYATENRYTEEELMKVVKMNGYELDQLPSDGDCEGLEEGVIVIEDDGRPIIKDGKHSHLNDNLEIMEAEKSHTALHIILAIIYFVGLMSMGSYILIPTVVIGLCWIAYVCVTKDNEKAC